jgi:hypothetical protein
LSSQESDLGFLEIKASEQNKQIEIVFSKTSCNYDEDTQSDGIFPLTLELYTPFW